MSGPKNMTLSFRVRSEVGTSIQKKAKREAVKVSHLLRLMTEREAGEPSRRMFRPEHEAILFETLLVNRFLYRFLAHIFGAAEVEASIAAIRREVRAEVREIFRTIDESEKTDAGEET
jgi:hypothetical protein